MLFSQCWSFVICKWFQFIQGFEADNILGQISIQHCPHLYFNKNIFTVPTFDTFGASIGSVVDLKTAGMNLSFNGVPAPASLNSPVAFGNLKNCPNKIEQFVPSFLSGLLLSPSACSFISSSRSGFVAMKASQLLGSHAL